MNPWTAAEWNLTEQGKYIKRYGVDAGARLARSVGSSLGALQPVEKQNNKIYIIRGRQGPPGKDLTFGTHEFLGFYGAGTFTADQSFTLAATPRATSFPTTNLPDESKANCRLAPTNDASFYLVEDVAAFMLDGSTLICTVNFLAGQTSGSFLYVTPPTDVPVDTALFLVCPHNADLTLTDLQIVFCGDPL